MQTPHPTVQTTINFYYVSDVSTHALIETIEIINHLEFKGNELLIPSIDL